SRLLDVLAARKDPYGLFGEVLIDGAPQPKNFKCISGYVTQILIITLNLHIEKTFKFKTGLLETTIVTVYFSSFKMNDLQRDLSFLFSLVGTEFIRGVSGGERRRTSIGMELITEPPVLFLDEPTTGLDASTANAVLTLLKRYHVL
uniref:ABC transporter domain-containing protein n=1 Tax=Latimeria chalumnae TaxID=7897 RepID=H2ZYH1_LATCH